MGDFDCCTDDDPDTMTFAQASRGHSLARERKIKMAQILGLDIETTIDISIEVDGGHAHAEWNGRRPITPDELEQIAAILRGEQATEGDER